MRNGWLAFAAACFALAFAIMALAASAKCKADPYDSRNHDAAIFCRMLDVDNSPAGVMEAFAKPINQGIDRDVIVDTVTYAVTVICPEYADELADAYAIYVPEKTSAPDFGAYRV